MNLGPSMHIEMPKLFDLKIYTNKGSLIGTIDDIIVDFERGQVYGLYVERSNADLVENGASISIPYRMVKAVDEIVILKAFPEKVKVRTN